MIDEREKRDFTNAAARESARIQAEDKRNEENEKKAKHDTMVALESQINRQQNEARLANAADQKQAAFKDNVRKI